MNKAMIKNPETGEWQDRSMEYLHGLTVAHYTKLGFYDHATALKEKEHALTEAVEVSEAVLKNQPGEVKNEIGDVLVTVINWAELEGIDIGGYFHSEAYRQSVPEPLCVEIHESITFLPTLGSLSNLFEALVSLAATYNFTLADCLGNAYEKVIARKVKLLDGTLIKEADWANHPELEGVEPL